MEEHIEDVEVVWDTKEVKQKCTAQVRKNALFSAYYHPYLVFSLGTRVQIPLKKKRKMAA